MIKLNKQGKRMLKLHKRLIRKKYKLKKSTDPTPTATPADGVPAASASSGDAISDGNKVDQQMNQFRDDNKGTGNAMWEYLGT